MLLTSTCTTSLDSIFGFCSAITKNTIAAKSITTNIENNIAFLCDFFKNFNNFTISFIIQISTIFVF